MISNLLFYIVAGFFLINLNSYAGNVKILESDATEFPILKAKVIISDDNGNILKTLSDNDLRIDDEGEVAKIHNISNEIIDSENQKSIILMLDSRLASDDYYLDFLENFINVLDLTKSEIALLGVHFSPILYSDFTQSKSNIIQHLSRIKKHNNSNIKQSLASFPVGADNVFTQAKFEKHIVLITDNYSNFEIDSIIEKYNQDKIIVHILHFSNIESKTLKQLSHSTEGSYLQFTKSEFTEENLANFTNDIINGFRYHTISWVASYSCISSRQASISHKISNSNAQFTYIISELSSPGIESTPPFLGFSSVLPSLNGSSFRELDLELRASNFPVTISSLRLETTFNEVFEITEGNVTQDLLLQPGDIHTVKIKYAPIDSAIVFTRLLIETDACFGDTILITGGFPNTPPNRKTIKIENPVCGQTLVPGDTVNIRWSGLLPRDVVQMEYSINNGESWLPLITDIFGLSYKWVVPNIKSDSVLIKLIQQWPNNIGRTLNFVHPGAVNSARFNNVGDEIVTACDDGTAIVWNANTGDRIMVLGGPEGHTRKVTYAEFSPDERYIATSSNDGRVIVWNKETGTVRFDIQAHTGPVNMVRFSYDGTRLISASNDRTVKIWRISEGTLVKTLVNPNNRIVYSAAFSPDDTEFIIADQTGLAKSFKFDDLSLIHNYDFTQGSGGVVYGKFADYSPDGKFIVVANILGSVPKGAVLFARNGNEPLFGMQHLSSENRSTLISSASFYLGKDRFGFDIFRILTAGFEDNTVIEWDGFTGDSIRVYKEHQGSVFTAEYNFDGARVLTASSDLTAKIWKLDSNFIQIDTLKCPFRIKELDYEFKPVAFDNVLLGNAQDSLFMAVIKNNSDFDLELRNFELAGDDKDDFRLYNYPNPKFIAPNDSLNINLVFEPKSIGFKTAELRYKVQAEEFNVQLSGTAVAPDVISSISGFEFNPVEIGEFTDSIIVSSFLNKRVENIEIDSIYIEYPNRNLFSLLEVGSQSQLSTDEKLEMTIRFAPEVVKRRAATVVLEHNGNNSPAMYSVLGQGFVPRYDTASIELEINRAMPGEVAKLELFLSNFSQAGISSSIYGLKTRLYFNPTILLPLGNVIGSDYKNDRKYIDVEFVFPDDFETLSQSTERIKIGEFEFSAALGNDTSSIISTSGTIPMGKGRLSIDEANVHFGVDGVCIDGGEPRLFFDSGFAFGLAQNFPNPASKSTSISFETIEKGRTKLTVRDFMGRVVNELVNEILPLGHHTVVLDLEDYSPGTYFYILETPSQKTTRRLDVVK